MSQEKDIVVEIKENARKDRARLEELADGLLTVSKDPTVQAEPLAKVAVAEQIAKVTDSLTRVNQALVEIAKMQSKEKILKGKPDAGLDKAEVENVYEEIESGGSLDS